MTAANQQAAEYGPAGRGGIKVAAGGAWTNVGPYRSNWIQNGLRVNESDTGRVRNFLVHPTNADIVYVLKSSGGLWKTTNFSHPRPNWRPMSDNVLSTSGGSVAFGKNPETLYLGTGDPFDPGVGGFIYKSTDGGETGRAGIKLGASTIIPDVKVDTSGAQDVVLVGTNAGLFRSTNGGATYVAVIGGGVHLEPPADQRRLACRASASAPMRCSCVAANQLRRRGRLTSTAGGVAPAGRITLAVGAPATAVVYAFAATANSAAQKDLYRSIDGGLTFAAARPADEDAGEPERRSAEHGHHARPGVLQPHGARRSGGCRAQHRLHRRSAQLGEVHRRRHDLAPRVELARAVRVAVRARRSSRRGASRPSRASRSCCSAVTAACSPATTAAATFSSQKNDGMSSYLIYAMTGNPKHRDDVLIGLQDNGTRWRVGPTGTYNQVFGGDGFGVGWSQAEDEISLASRLLLVHHPQSAQSAEHAEQVGSRLERHRRVHQPGADVLQHLDRDAARRPPIRRA